MMQHYFDTQAKVVIHCDPERAPVSPTWIAVSEADAGLLCQEYAYKPTRKDVILTTIRNIEATITPRRLREALISGDMTFLITSEEEITALRKELTLLSGGSV